ncbi:MAG: ferredoxin [Limimaricola sp.]|nr:ferredoxin [Limimaricola sp.]
MTDLAADCAREGLAILGGMPVEAAPGLPEGTRSLLLLGPAEPAFWPRFQSSPEAADGAPNPLDRWSMRVIGALAQAHGGTALFPFGGPPWHPFYSWALASGRAHASPIGLLVHVEAGLFVSYRGAIALPRDIDLPPPLPSPCPTCAAPCRTACPVGAFDAGYDVAACHGFLATPAGDTCMTQGCAARRACPVGAGRRDPAQSAFHMRAFHPS